MEPAPLCKADFDAESGLLSLKTPMFVVKQAEYQQVDFVRPKQRSSTHTLIDDGLKAFEILCTKRAI